MESRTIDYKILDKRYEIEKYRHDEDNIIYNMIIIYNIIII